jgi:hypothetical protein
MGKNPAIAITDEPGNYFGKRNIMTNPSANILPAALAVFRIFPKCSTAE